MSCGKEHETKDDLEKQKEWEKKNPSCTPTIDKECPHVHPIPEDSQK